MKVLIETELYDLPGDTLERLDKFIQDEFCRKLRKRGIPPRNVIATSPWRIMLPIQYERDARAKKKK